MKYLVNDEVVTKEKFNEELEKAVENYVDDHYDELLDECYPMVKIGYLEFSPSQILKECDPVAYRCGYGDEKSYQLDNYQSEFESPYTEQIDGVWFETQDDEEDEEAEV